MLFVFLLFLFNLNDADLLADRYATAELWTTRANNPTLMNLVYSDQYSDPNMVHYAKGVGAFGPPREIALEYDSTIFINFGPPNTIAFTIYDPTTIKFISEDVWLVYYYVNFTQGYDTQTGNYAVYQSIFRSMDYIIFIPGTAKLLLAYTDFGSDYAKSIASSNAVIDPTTVCEIFIFGSCNGSALFGGPRPYLNLTGFTTVLECINFLNNLQPTVCPYIIQSNTSICRLIHGLSAVLLPEVHCPHVRPYDSMVCFDQCLPECSNCDSNAECVALNANIPTDFTTHYKCQCKNGYIGNGTSCTPLSCTSGQCPSSSGTYNCSSGLCKCTETFSSNPTNYTNNNLCTCPSPSKVFWNLGKPVCVPEGRCIDDTNNRYNCQSWGQNYNQVKCTALPNNRWAIFGVCTCNYGYIGGAEFSCQCDASRRVVWSTTLNGDVCLNVTECTENWHCTYPLTCVKQSGQPIGKCSSSRKRNFWSN